MLAANSASASWGMTHYSIFFCVKLFIKHSPQSLVTDRLHELRHNGMFGQHSQRPIGDCTGK